MSMLKAAALVAVLAVVAGSATQRYTGEPAQLARRIHIGQAKIAALCAEGVSATPLRARPGHSPVVVEAHGGRELDVPVAALVFQARLEGHALFNAHDDYDGAVRYTRFQTRLARPERAWKLVLQNVQGQEDELSNMMSPRVRAVLFDQDNVEQGRWQGRAIFEGGACAQSGVTLWQYLQLQHPPQGQSPRLRYTYVRGKAEPIAPRKLLPSVPDVIAVGDSGARCRAEKLPHRKYRITDGEHSLELREHGNTSRAETTVFLCDDKGVLAASQFEAHRFSWDGESARMWAYPQPGLPNTTATLLVRDIAGRDAVLELQLPDEDKAYRLTLPDWRAQAPVPEGMLTKWDSHCAVYSQFPFSKESLKEYDCAAGK